MPELIEQMYCSQQIVIPPKFPYILKRYCKAAIKTQPYDLLRWSFEYFKALAQHRPPPVKLRLEYPIYSTEGGLTRGCLKVLAYQLAGMDEVPLQTLKRAWQGFCLDPEELRRMLCLCEVYLRKESVTFLYFIAVAAGLLTKCLTHTMILTCETLTKEPDGGSAAIPTEWFLKMYRFLAHLDASKGVRYLNGYKEGTVPHGEPAAEEEETPESEYIESEEEKSLTEYFQSSTDLHKLHLINDHVTKNTKISMQIHRPVLYKITRSPSVERDAMIEREKYMRERTGKPDTCEDVDEMLRHMSASKVEPEDRNKEAIKQEKVEKVEKKDKVEIHVQDENDVEIPFEFYSEPEEVTIPEDTETVTGEQTEAQTEEEEHKTEKEKMAEKIALYVAESYRDREDRLEDLEHTFDEITSIVDRYKAINYDLGMIAGRQMSTTSGEFIVAHVEREIMSYIDEQIAILPDPDLKKKKAKPEEVKMVREILQTFLDENMDLIVPELEEAEEEEQPIPEVTVVYAVPGIGEIVDEEIIQEFEEYALEVSHVQAGVFMPRNIRHFLCPPLEKYEEHKYEEEHTKKEEVATGGAFAET